MYSTPSATTLAAGTEESLKLATGEDTLVGVAVADSRVFLSDHVGSDSREGEDRQKRDDDTVANAALSDVVNSPRSS
jgi:hypothetical protein